MSIEVRRSPIEGRGLFATKTMRADTVLEISPVLIVPPDEVDTMDETILRRYVFDWDGESHAVVLGMASMANHSEEPNAELYLEDAEDGPIAELVITRRVRSGEEILIDYGPDHFS